MSDLATLKNIGRTGGTHNHTCQTRRARAACCFVPLVKETGTHEIKGANSLLVPVENQVYNILNVE